MDGIDVLGVVFVVIALSGIGYLAWTAIRKDGDTPWGGPGSGSSGDSEGSDKPERPTLE